jgi:hypothetical protein
MQKEKQYSKPYINTEYTKWKTNMQNKNRDTIKTLKT